MFTINFSFFDFIFCFFISYEMSSTNTFKKEINDLVIKYKEIYNPTSEEEMNDFESFKLWVEEMEELKQCTNLTEEEQAELNKYNNLPYELEYDLLMKISYEIKNTNYNRNQKIDKTKYYINVIDDIKKRSKHGIPQINNITAIQICQINDNIDIENYKGFTTVTKNNNVYTDMNMTTIKNQLNKSCYELLPYTSYDFYGCQYVKTCFNTIGKDYEFISPFIDYDLESSILNFNEQLQEAFNLILTFANKVICLKCNHISIVGYSNVDKYDLIFNSGYVHIQHKPNSGKFLSLHVVYSDIKIHCVELLARIEQNIDELKQFKGFDIAPYKTGSLRHMGSCKAGLSEHPEDKKVDDLTNSQILDQFITYYNDRLNIQRIELNINNIHNIEQKRKFKLTNNNNYDVELRFGGEHLDYIENIMKLIGEQNLMNVDYSNRWSLLIKYISYKRALGEEIIINNNLLGSGHEHVATQINFLLTRNIRPTPIPLLNLIKSLLPGQFDYTIKNNSVVKHHFGQNKIEDLKQCKTFKEVIEVLTGSIAISTDGRLFYYSKKSSNVIEYKITGKPNLYVARCYPSALNIIITPEDLLFDDNDNAFVEDETLSVMFRRRLNELANQHRKQEILINAHTLIQLLIKFYDVYYENGKTTFKLNGYDVTKVKKDVYDDVVKIIKLFEDRLVDDLKKNNPLKEFFEAIKYLFVYNEKPEKAFLAVDKCGATGKSVFFSKIIKDLFGLAGLNDDSLNCLDSSFSDGYNYLYTVFNEVSKGKHTVEQCTSKLKQLTDNIICSASVKNVQNKKRYKNNGIYVLLSNSLTLNGALDYTDSALMSRLVYIEFKPFENNGVIDTLAGTNYYNLIDKYKSYRDDNYIFTYDFRNALFKYIMDIDIKGKNIGRAQLSEYKDEVYREVAKERLDEITNKNKPNINDNKLYAVTINGQHKTLTNYTEGYDGLVGFQISNLNGINQDSKDFLLKSMDYKSAYAVNPHNYTYKHGDKTENLRFRLIICEYKKLSEFVIINETNNINL